LNIIEKLIIISKKNKKIDISENRNFGDYVYIKDIPTKISWKLDKSEFHNLHRRNLDISIFVKG